MLESMRRGANTWVAKLFIGLLVLSFAVWGVADIFTGYRGTDVAEVGKTPITVDQYRAALQREIQQASSRFGSYLTMDQARAFGLDTQVLARLMAEAALDDEARTRGLGVTDQVVAESISADPAFQTPGGQFDRSYFQQVLRSVGYSEAMYVAEQRNTLLRQMIADAIAGGIEAPEVLEKAIDRYRNETRSAEYIVVTPAMSGTVPEPTEEQLRAYYNDNKADFRAPEYRKLAILSLQPEDLAAGVEIPEEDLKASYDADPDRFGTPERRAIERIVFPDMGAARIARGEIDGGKTFEDIAAGLDLTEEDRKLGTLTRDGVLDPAIAEAAFGLAVGEISQPVSGTFGPVLVRVTDVEPGSARTFEDVREEIRAELAVDRAADRILDMYDTVEDERAGGMTLAEIGQKHALTFREIATVDRQGRAPDDSRVTGIPEASAVLEEAFTTDIGVEADPQQTSDDGWVWFDVLDVIASRELGFDEAREKVAQAWRADQTRDLVSAKAREVAEKLRGGTTFFAMAEELGTTSGLIGPITRNSRDSDFGPPAIQLLFSTPRDAIAETQADRPRQRVVFRVTDITVPDFQPDAAETYRSEIVTGMTNDIMGQYLKELENRIGTSVNPEALRLALGETDQ